MWDQPSRLEAGLEVLLCKHCWPDLCIDLEEVYLIDMVDALAGQLLDLITVRTLKWRKAAHIKWLEEVGGGIG